MENYKYLHAIFNRFFLFLKNRDNPSFWQGLGIDYHYEVGYEYTFLLEEIYHYSLQQFAVDVTGVWKGKPPVMSLPINGYSYGK